MCHLTSSCESCKRAALGATRPGKIDSKMEITTTNTKEEIRRLQSCINDLISLLALPAIWAGQQPPEVVETLLDALLGILRLDFVYFRQDKLAGGLLFEAARVAGRQKSDVDAEKIGRALASWLKEDASTSPCLLPNPITSNGSRAGEEVTVVSCPLGLNEGSGVVVAGSRRRDFPDKVESLLLKVAVNQTAIELQGKRLLSERNSTQVALFESEERLRLALHAANIGTWDYNPITGALKWDKRCKELFGLGETEVSYDTFLAGLHPADREQTDAAVKRALDPASGGDYDIEYRTVGIEDGVERWIAAKGRAYFDATGRAVRFVGTAIDVSEHKRAALESEEQARLAALGMDVGTALTQAATLPAMLNDCCEALVRHLNAAFSRIWIFNQKDNVLELQASAGLDTHLDGSHGHIPVGQYKIGLIAQERKPHLTNDVQNDPRIRDKEWVKQAGIVAFAGYPLTVEDRLIGVMAILARQPLTDIVFQRMGSVADNIAVGIERKRTETDLREQTEVVETINRVGQILSAELDINKIVQALTDAATELTGAQYGAFFYNVINEEGESYHLYTLSGVPREAFAHFPLPRNTDLFGPTFRGEGIVRSDDVKKDPRYGKNSPYYGIPPGHLPVTSYLAVPVVSRSGEVLGGLFFAHPEPGVFTERDEQIVVGLAAQAAIAMDNASLFEMVEQERAQAEASEQRYRFVAEAIPQIVWTAAADGAVDYFNQKWCDYTGQAREQSYGWGWYGAIHPEQLPATNECWTHSIKTGEPCEVEYLLKRADGIYRWHLARALPMRDAQGRIIKWFGTCTDIHDKKQAEEERAQRLANEQEYSARLKALADAALAINASLSSDELFQVITEKARELIGAHQAVTSITVNQDWSQVINTMALSEKYAAWRNYNTRSDGTDIYSLVCRINRPLRMTQAQLEAHRHWRGFDQEAANHPPMRGLLAAPLIARDGRNFGLIQLSDKYAEEFTAEDESILVQLSQMASIAIENTRLYSEAQAANRAKDEFLAMVSHEVRTPMTAILGWARMLRAGQLDEATRVRAIETIERNVKTQAQLIEDLLDISRIITGKLKLDTQVVDLRPVIEAAIETVRPAAEAKSIQLQALLHPGTSPVTGDAGRLQQVVWNLLSNAVKFTDPGGFVEISLTSNDTQVKITVRDTGKGINPDFLPYVFDRFRQADTTSTRIHGGLGLGLAIVRHLVEMHGGTVEAASKGEGKGATFTVTLPTLALYKKPAAVSALDYLTNLSANGIVTGSQALNGVRVLIVEDDADTLAMLTLLLQQSGAEVIVATSAAEGLEFLKINMPDVIVSDISMPGEDGYSLIRKIRALRPEEGGQTPAVALTAYAKTEDRVRALSAGFQQHIAKPVEPIEMITVVANLAGRFYK